MGYKSNIPLVTDDIGATSYLDIKNNFTEIETSIEIDHVGFDVDSSGKHNKVTLVEQLESPETGSDEVALFSKRIDGDLLLFFKGEDNAEESVMSKMSAGAAASSLTMPGWIRLSSGVLLKWYSISNLTNPKVYNFPQIDGEPEFEDVFYPVIQTYTATPSSNASNKLNYYNFSKKSITLSSNAWSQLVSNDVKVLVLVIGR